MRQTIKWVVLNHRVISTGNLTGYMRVEGKRGQTYWF